MRQSNEGSVVLVVVGGAAGQTADDSLLVTHRLHLSDWASHALKHSNILFRLAPGNHDAFVVQTGIEGHVMGETFPLWLSCDQPTSIGVADHMKIVWSISSHSELGPGFGQQLIEVGSHGG